MKEFGKELPWKAGSTLREVGNCGNLVRNYLTGAGSRLRKAENGRNLVRNYITGAGSRLLEQDPGSERLEIEGIWKGITLQEGLIHAKPLRRGKTR